MSPAPRLALAALLTAGAMLSGTPARAQPVQGFVDLHSHLMAEHSFGGGWFSGTLEGPMDVAVQRCDGNLPLATHASTMFPVVSEFLGADTGWHAFKRRGYDRRQCRRVFGIKVPGTCPEEHFEQWPMWNAIAHQQMWQGWLQSAHQRGMRVMVVSLAESNFLCSVAEGRTRRYNCDEMESVRRQLSALRGFVSRNSGWVAIAGSPAEARTAIQQGKLVLVPAVEVTQLFPSGNFLTQLDDLRALGIRSVQVVHHSNNRFGGAAPIPELVNAANLVEVLMGNITRINDTVCRDGSGNQVTCDGDGGLNEQGLTPEGVSLVNAMMDRGMLLDVAHLSRKAFAQTYGLAAPRGYPLLYSHTHMWEAVSSSEKRHEKYLRANEFQMIRNEGGMIGLRTGFEATTQAPGSCQGSTHSFAQSLRYAVDNNLKVGFGADLNGFAKHVKPRYGSDGASCDADRAQINAAGGPNEFHKKGLAHVGLLPDLINDMRAVGTPAAYLDHLNGSAENFLQLWEKSVFRASSAPVNLALQAAASASSTFCSGSAEHCYSAARVNDGNRSTALGGTTSWANQSGSGMPQWLELNWGRAVSFSRVELYSSQGYELRDFDLQAEVGTNTNNWVTLRSVDGNTSTISSHSFSPTTASRLRVRARSGPGVQPGHARINELEVY